MIVPWGSSSTVEIVDALGPDLVAAGGLGGRRRLTMVDPAKLATWANAVTVGRLLLSPLMFLVIPDDNRGSWVGVRAVVRAVRQRRHRRLPRPPARRDQRRVRSSTRSPTRCSCSGRCSRSSPATCSGSCPVADHRRPRVRHQRVPHGRRGEGRQRAGQQAGQVQDALPAARRRVRALAVVRGRRASGCGTSLLWIAVVLAVVSGAQYLAAHAEAADGATAQACDRPATACDDDAV